MESTNIDFKKRDKIIVAASYEFIEKVDDSVVFALLNEVMRHRMEIAKLLIKSNYNSDVLMDVYDYCDNKIKDILGL